MHSVASSKFDMRNEQQKKIGELQLTTKSIVLFEGADTEVYKKTTTFSEELVKELSVINNLTFLPILVPLFSCLREQAMIDPVSLYIVFNFCLLILCLYILEIIPFFDSQNK